MSTNTLFCSVFNTNKLGKIFYSTFLLTMLFALPASAQVKEKVWRTLTVSGMATETIPTSLSKVSLGVVIEAKTAQEAQQEAANKSSAVVDFLKSQNVDKLTTTGVSLQPIFSYKNEVRRISGYSASNTVSFQFPITKAGKLLDQVVKIGATQINTVSFVAADQAISNAQKQALKAATQDAKEQADAVLSHLGLQAKEITSIQINRASAPPPITLQRAEARASFADASTPIVGGEQEVQASVTLEISY
jgi:uncharacterized protein YggE